MKTQTIRTNANTLASLSTLILSASSRARSAIENSCNPTGDGPIPTITTTHDQQQVDMKTLKRLSARSVVPTQRRRIGQAWQADNPMKYRCCVALTVLVNILAPLPSAGQAIAIAPGNLVAATANPAALGGPGAVCAYAEMNGVKDPAGPGPNTGMCSDMAMIGPPGMMSPIIDLANTTKIGNAVAPPAGGAGAGRGLLYNRDVSNNKPADAAARGGTLVLATTAVVGAPPVLPYARSTATQAFRLNPGSPTGFSDVGLATAEAQPRPAPAADVGHAVGIVDDPIKIGLANPAMPGLIQVSIGNGSQGVFLMASKPGDFAQVFYELGTSATGPLLSFSMQIDSSTKSLTAANFTFDFFNPAIGYANPNAFLNDVLLPSLTFNPSLHELVGASSIPIFDLTMPPDSSDITLTYNYGAIAGTSAPEPSSLLLLGSGVLGLAGFLRKRMVT